MDSALKISSTNLAISPSSSSKSHFPKTSWFGFTRSQSALKIHASSDNGSLSQRVVRNAVGDVHKQRSSLESLFCYDKAIPEEIIEKPIGLSLNEKNIGGNPRCFECEAKGAVLCATCSGSGLYVDSILESQGIIVKVRCLGCGGTGNIMCSHCGGRGHCHVG